MLPLSWHLRPRGGVSTIPAYLFGTKMVSAIQTAWPTAGVLGPAPVTSASI
jgi:hypothetical protein